MAAEGMFCPIDRTPLVMSERQGIEIDYCPACEAAGSIAANWTRSSNATPPPRPEARQRESYRERDGGRHYGHPKRCKSFLEELFD